MSTKEDSLVSILNPERVNYATGVMLNADDFIAEQGYHRGRLARALGYLHGYGTVAGLRVLHEPASSASMLTLSVVNNPQSESKKIGGVLGEPLGSVPLGANVPIKKHDTLEASDVELEERITVQPGLAIDRYGRLIEVSKPFCLRLNRWFLSQAAEKLEDARHEGSTNAVIADLFVRFVTCEHGKTPAFASGPFNSLDAITAARLRDYFEFFMVLRPKTLPLPVPVSPWEAIADVPVGDRKDALNEAVLDSWRDGSEFSDENGLIPLVEHSGVSDTSSLLLARVEIPAIRGEGSGTGADTPRPVRTEDPVVIENNIRHFVYAAGALAQWLDK